jgi:hypothetical protein
VLQYSFNYGKNRSVRRLKKVAFKPRQLQMEPGGTVGSRPFFVSVKVEPSEEKYEAEAFLCDKKNAALAKSAAPKSSEEAIRVCVRPNAAARARGVFMRRVASFRFQHDDTSQFAVETGGRQADDGKTLLLCSPGDDMCVFKTTLATAFYKGDSIVEGTGEVYLQFGRESTITTRRANIRGLQITNSDSEFAGASEVSFEFNVVPDDIIQEENWQDEAEAFWMETPKILRVVYIVLAVVLFLVVLCILCCPCFFCCGRKKDDEKKINAQKQASPKMMPPANFKRLVITNESPGRGMGEPQNSRRNVGSKSPKPGRRRQSNGGPNTNAVGPPFGIMGEPQNLNQSTGTSPRRGMGEPQNSRRSVGSKSPKPGRRHSSGGPNTTAGVPSFGIMGEPQNLKQSTGTSPRRGMGEPQNSRRSVGSKSPKPGRRHSSGGPNTTAGGPSFERMGEPQNLKQITGICPRRGMGEPQNSRRSVGSKSPKPGRRRHSSGEPNTTAGGPSFGIMGEPQNLKQIAGVSPRRGMGEPQNSRRSVGSKSPKPGRRRHSSGEPNTTAGGPSFGIMGEPQNLKQITGISPRRGMGEPQNSRRSVGSKSPKPGRRRHSAGVWASPLRTPSRVQGHLAGLDG